MARTNNAKYKKDQHQCWETQLWTECRSFIQLTFKINDNKYSDSFLVDTGSQITIVRDDFIRNKLGNSVEVKGITGHTLRMNKLKIKLCIYEKEIEVSVLCGSVPYSVLGIE